MKIEIKIENLYIINKRKKKPHKFPHIKPELHDDKFPYIRKDSSSYMNQQLLIDWFEKNQNPNYKYKPEPKTKRKRVKFKWI